MLPSLQQVSNKNKKQKENILNLKQAYQSRAEQ